MYTQWNEITDSYSCIATGISLRRTVTPVRQSELKAVPLALADSMGSVHMEATPKNSVSTVQDGIFRQLEGRVVSSNEQQGITCTMEHRRYASVPGSDDVSSGVFNQLR